MSQPSLTDSMVEVSLHSHLPFRLTHWLTEPPQPHSENSIPLPVALMLKSSSMALVRWKLAGNRSWLANHGFPYVAQSAPIAE